MQSPIDEYSKPEGKGQTSLPEPHPRDGHLRLPNYIVERLAKLRLNGTQWQILWAVWRHTLCWQQPGEWRNRPYPISIDDLVDDTGINKYQLKRELGHLIGLNIIHRDNTPGGRGHKPLTAFNLDPHTWNTPLNGSEIATLKERVAGMIPFTEQKGSEIATPTMKKVEEKGSELVTPSVADSLPFTNRSATLSVPKSSVLNKRLKKHNKETVATPAAGELKMLDILKGLKGWRYDQADDLAWLREFMSDYPDFSVAQVKECRDYYSGKPLAKHKGTLKIRLRNWMAKEREFEKGGEQYGRQSRGDVQGIGRTEGYSAEELRRGLRHS